MSNLAIGDLVYWNKSGAKSYWTASPKYPVEGLTEEFLEGESVEPIPYQEQYAYDVPNTGASVNPSKLDQIAGTISGEAKKSGAAIYYPINMPFTFYNLDGTNHDDSSKTLKVFVNVKDISNTISTDVSQEEIDKATATPPKASKPDIATNPRGTTQTDTTDKKTSIWVYVGIGVGIFLAGVITWLLLRPKQVVQQATAYYNPYQPPQTTTLGGLIFDSDVTKLSSKMNISKN